MEDIGREQTYVSMLYGRLDAMREHAAERLAGSLKETGGTPQARLERDSATTMYNQQLAELNGVEAGLCFGRLDFHGGERRYVGRIGIFDDSDAFEPLLIDWRAPAARLFYLATAASPEGVDRRRHIRTRQRQVIGLDDEVLDLSAAQDTRHTELTSEAALLSALTASRTGRMRDIVETIQVEQDRVIRADLGGILVVQGGPGTGKTAVALHRAAYLLYTYRDQLATRGVLIVGPNATFLRYISHVLPTLAETGVLLGTVGDLYPGVVSTRAESTGAAEVKGRAEMAAMLANAVADRQNVPDEDIELLFERETLTLRRDACVRARARARRSGKLHNLARAVFARHVVDALARQLAERIGTDPFAFDPLGGDDAPGDPNIFGEADMADIRRDIEAHAAVQATLHRLWPILTPQQFLRDLLASEERLATAAPDLADAERLLLMRSADDGWSAADVPLLDEAAELLGEDDRAAQARAEALRRERIVYAQGALDIVEGSRSMEFEDELDSELLTATDLVDAERLAARHEAGERLTIAERAAADRGWAFGHIIVDEAQELSPMAWRMLMRRSPSRSMTVVGDIAQTSDLAGTSSWQAALAPYVEHRWRLEELTVNYRTPAEIMKLAAGVLDSIDPTLEPPRSVRSTGVAPWVRRTEPGALGEGLAKAVLHEATEAGDGQIGVIVPARRLEELAAAVREAIPDAAVGEAPELETRVVVLSVRQAKGLEFDSVLVVDPQAIVDESSRGQSDLYVALTRATQRLGVLHDGPLPESLGG